MRVEKQLSVFLDNKPGSLAATCRDLAAHDINIEAISVANLVDHAVVRLIVSDPRAAELMALVPWRGDERHPDLVGSRRNAKRAANGGRTSSRC